MKSVILDQFLDREGVCFVCGKALRPREGFGCVFQPFNPNFFADSPLDKNMRNRAAFLYRICGKDNPTLHWGMTPSEQKIFIEDKIKIRKKEETFGLEIKNDGSIKQLWKAL